MSTRAGEGPDDEDGPHFLSAANEQLDVLFSQQADEEIGDVQELGWFGLIRHASEPGGVILRVDVHGMRSADNVDSEGALSSKWASITSDYGEYYEQRSAYE